MMTVSSSIRDYQVDFVETMEFLASCESLASRYYVIDQNVWELYKGSFDTLNAESTLILPINEEAKCLETVKTVYDAIMKCSAKRNMTLIPLAEGLSKISRDLSHPLSIGESIGFMCPPPC